MIENDGRIRGAIGNLGNVFRIHEVLQFEASPGADIDRQIARGGKEIVSRRGNCRDFKPATDQLEVGILGHFLAEAAVADQACRKPPRSR